MADNGVVPAPKSTPAKFGLFSAATVIRESSDAHWPYGFEAETESCNFNATLIPLCDTGQDPIEILTAEGPHSKTVKPFAIEVSDECLSVGTLDQDSRARVFRKLETVTQYAVEREFARGEYTSAATDGDGLWLASEDAINLTTGPVSPVLGVALLEQALATCGGGAVGVIHMPRDVAAIAGNDYELDADSMRTKFGNLVVAGSGYTGAGPGDVERDDDLKPWIYATGQMVVRLGEPELVTPTITEAIDAKTNATRWVASRSAAVWWDGCCHFAVQVDLTIAAGNNGAEITPAGHVMWGYASVTP